MHTQLHTGLGNGRTDGSGTHNTDRLVLNRTTKTVIPKLAGLALYPSSQLALKGQQVSQHILRHLLSEHVFHAGKLIISEAVMCEGRHTCPGGLQPLHWWLSV